MRGGDRLPGKFVWADLVTYDIAAVRPFYSRVCGWTFRDLGGYWIASNDERPVAGLLERPKPTDPNARPRWFGYISVPGVSRAESSVRKAGGKVIAPPQKFPGRGEQAVFLDAEGAMFGVVRSSSGDPEDFLPSPGDWIWIQLLSRDARKAAEFYRTVAGYEVVENTQEGRMSDFVLTSRGYARATVRGSCGCGAGAARLAPVRPREERQGIPLDCRAIGWQNPARTERIPDAGQGCRGGRSDRCGHRAGRMERIHGGRSTLT